MSTEMGNRHPQFILDMDLVSRLPLVQLVVITLTPMAQKFSA